MTGRVLTWELPDFHPESGHLHTCNEQGGCGCASALYAVAEDLASRVDWTASARVPSAEVPS